MLNILVTGSNGQLGSEIRELSSAYQDRYFFTDKKTLDITKEQEIKDFIEINDIDIIINCAAYTEVDKAEEDAINADKINHLAVTYLAEIAKTENIKLVHISTDYIFDGKNHRPYVENDTVSPQGIYGKTKCLSEQAIMAINPMNSIIIRTSWMYSSFGHNFLKTLLRLGKEKEELDVVFDQVGTPTYARDLAKTILDILPSITNKNVEIYHYSNEGVLSWYDFAKEIMRIAKLNCKINPIETRAYPTLAKRPHYSLLNKSKIKKKFNIEVPYWKDSLNECLKTMGEKK